MQQITINAEYLFEFKNFQQWTNTAQQCYKSLGSSLAIQTVCIDVQGNALTLGSDFIIAERSGNFPVKVYRLIRTSEVVKEEG